MDIQFFPHKAYFFTTTQTLTLPKANWVVDLGYLPTGSLEAGVEADKEGMVGRYLKDMFFRLHPIYILKRVTKTVRNAPEKVERFLTESPAVHLPCAYIAHESFD